MIEAMVDTMKAAVWHGVEDVRSETVAVPELGPRDVLLAIKAVGICGSDLHVYRKGMYDATPGQIMGHEFCGELVAAGSEVVGLTLGDRYTGFTISYCGTCWACTHGQPRLCPSLFKGYSGYGKPGAMAEFLRIEDAKLGENLMRIPDELSDEAAAMAEPLGTAIYTGFRVKPKHGDTVVVIGAGLIGNLVVQAFKALADVRVIVTEVSPERAELARGVGADEVIDASREDLFEAVCAATGSGAYAFGPSGMADIVIDAAAAPPTFGQALEFVRPKGTVGLIGSPEYPSTADTSLIINKDIRVVGVFGSTIPHGLEMLVAGQIRTDVLISHRFSLEEAAAAFAVAADPSSTKVMFKP
jgi:threonine dehydrogenase-like Zn-dependent dehydrogenase